MPEQFFHPSALEAGRMETPSDASFSLHEDGAPGQCDGYLVPHSPCIVDDGEFGALHKDRVHRLAVPQLAYVAWVEEQLDQVVDTLQQRMDMQQKALEQRLERLVGDKCARFEERCVRIQNLQESHQTEMTKELKDVREFLSTSLSKIERNVAELQTHRMSDSASLYSLIGHAQNKTEEHIYNFGYFSNSIESLRWSLNEAEKRIGLLEGTSQQSSEALRALTKGNRTDVMMNSWQEDIIQQVNGCVERLDEMENLISPTRPSSRSMPRGESTERRGRDSSADSLNFLSLC